MKFLDQAREENKDKTREKIPVFIEKVRIENGYTREEFGMLSQTKIEELLHDPLLVKFMINDDRSMTLNEVEEAIKGWKK